MCDGIARERVLVVRLRVNARHRKKTVPRLALVAVGDTWREPACGERGRWDVVIRKIIIGADRFVGTDAQSVIAVVFIAPECVGNAGCN